MSAEPTAFRLSPAVRAATPYLEPRTWGALAYVWLSFPLGLAWFGTWIAARPASQRHSYGLLRAEVIVALVNGLLMLLVVIGIVYEAIERLHTPQPVRGLEVMGIAEDGPLGRLIKKLDRVDTRPLHIHAIVTAAGFHTLTTQSHFEGDPRVGNTLEPRTTPESSVHATQLHDDPADFKARGLDAPYHTVTHDYVLRPVTPAV